LFIGSSTAMNLVAAVKAARRLGPSHTVATVLCDSGSRHLTRFWNDTFIAARGLNVPTSGIADDTSLRFVA
jgi:cysteine synthase A